MDGAEPGRRLTLSTTKTGTLPGGTDDMGDTSSFKAYRVHQADDGVAGRFDTIALDDLGAGEVVIKGHYSSVNYKDALAATGAGKIMRRFPLVGGIDVAGEVVSSEDERYAPGDQVLVTGCGLGSYTFSVSKEP